jgi:phosphatidylglycerol---prolipoprotein diacylglyceryl transferase
MTFTLANGFTFTIDPVIARIGSLNLYWYGFAYTFGFAGLWVWLELQRGQLGWSARRSSEACVILIVAIMLSGRLFEVAVYEWDWYRYRPREILMFWKGGMATHGLLLGSIVGAAIIATWMHTPLLRLLDMLSVPAAFIFGVGRLGNFIEGGVIGTPTSVPWGVNIPDVEGFRHPVALYDGLKNLLLVPVLMIALRRWPAGTGMATGCFLLGYGGLRFLVDQFRDYESVLLGLGPGQWFNLAMAAAGLAMLLVCRRRMKTRSPAVPAVVVGSKERAYGRPLRVAALIALIVFPLCIPNSWDTEHLQAKREQHAGAAPPWVPAF